MSPSVPAWAVPWSGRGERYEKGEIATVVEVMRTADPLTQGSFQHRLEERFRVLFGARHAFATSSATAALELAALLCRLTKGDDVIMPAHTFAASAIPFGRTGARLVWADIDPGTRVVTAETIARVLTPRTRVLVVVHLYGLVCDMNAILDLARRKSLIVVEDAAQCIGARYKGRHAGTLGDFGCFSFHGHKNISTLGEGGMLTVRDASRARMVPGLRHNGVRPFSSQKHYWLPAMSDVDFDVDGLWPYNFCIGEPQCALALKMLERLEPIIAKRRARALRFRAALADFPELSFQEIPEGRGHAFHLMTARYDGPRGRAGRDDFIARMAYVHKVQVIQQYHPLYRYPLFRKAGFGAADCPNTDHYYDRMVSFPFHGWLPQKQFDYMLDATRETLTYLRGTSRTRACSSQATAAAQ